MARHSCHVTMGNERATARLCPEVVPLTDCVCRDPLERSGRRIVSSTGSVLQAAQLSSKPDKLLLNRLVGIDLLRGLTRHRVELCS